MSCDEFSIYFLCPYFPYQNLLEKTMTMRKSAYTTPLFKKKLALCVIFEVSNVQFIFCLSYFSAFVMMLLGALKNFDTRYIIIMGVHF